MLFGFGNCIGTLRFSNGDIYTGEFNYGKPNGKGAFTYGNGDSYSGTVAEGQRHGSGTYNSAAGDKYVGQFNEGKFDGLGVYYFLANNRSRGDIYVGEFSSNTFNGQGRYTHANGQVFVGSFSSGRKLLADAAVAVAVKPEPIVVAAAVSKQTAVETSTVVAVPKVSAASTLITDKVAVQVSAPAAKVDPFPVSVEMAQQLYGSKDSAVKAPLAAESRTGELFTASGERSKWYITGGVGYWNLSFTCTPSPCTMNSNPWGASLGLGYEINKNIFIDGNISSAGRYTAGFLSPDESVTSVIYYSSLGASFLYGLSNNTSLLLSGGYYRADLETNIFGTSQNYSKSQTSDNSYLTVGIDYRLTNNTSIRFSRSSQLDYFTDSRDVAWYDMKLKYNFE
jgi:hypothetical protein